MRQTFTFGFAVVAAMLLAPAATAQEADAAPACGVYEGVVCTGYFTDDAGIVDDDQRLEDAIAGVVNRQGNEIAVVTVADSSPEDPRTFAQNLGNEWGVGGPNQDGIVVLIDVAARRTEIGTGDGLVLDTEQIAAAGNSFFGGGDFEGGLLAIMVSLERDLARIGDVQPVAVAAPGLDVNFECGEYAGVVCAGYFTDAAGLVDDDQRVEDAIARVVGRHGNQIAMVTVMDSSPESPAEFAQNLGNEWGIGGPEQDGVVVLVDIAARRTEVRTGDGLTLNAERIAGAGNSFFGVGDFEGGVLAIVGSLEQGLDAEAEGITSAPLPEDDTGRSIVGWILGAAALGGGGVVVARTRSRRKEERLEVRSGLVDDQLDKLDVPGHELPQLIEYTVAPPDDRVADISTNDAIEAMRAIDAGRHPDDDAIPALRVAELVAIIDRDRLLSDVQIPLELAASDERDILERAVQDAARVAQDGAISDRQFEVNLQELARLVASLRPHRLAADRKRFGQAMSDRAVDTAHGAASLTDGADRFLEAAPAFDRSAGLSESLAEMAEVYENAVDKTARLEQLMERLPESTARPAVAAALADVSDDLDASVEDYEILRDKLERAGTALEADGLDVPAIAALLLMNHDETNVEDFVAAYNSNRGRGIDPGEAVELALAGLRHPSDIKLVRAEATRLGLPVSITTALLRRRDDGPEVYEQLLRELAGQGIEDETRRTIAGILAVSLEPARATQSWVAARKALADLGLEGSYADVAAAFGASDYRGPRRFALAYAAQRQALARSKVEGADRFAPELAHDGTRYQTDSWTRDRIPSGLYHFDPFTLLFYHWVITKGSQGWLGRVPIYRDQSWAGDRGAWWEDAFSGWGGGGGFSGGGGGSSW
jgi:uncharacterized membrane protein YgcG